MKNIIDRFKSSVRRRMKVNKTRCNICDRVFKDESRFARFCRACKQDDELYRFAGWLPGRMAFRQK